MTRDDVIMSCFDGQVVTRAEYRKGEYVNINTILVHILYSGDLEVSNLERNACYSINNETIPANRPR